LLIAGVVAASRPITAFQGSRSVARALIVVIDSTRP